MENHLKIAILGTRGIPNNYGGFEQCAEIISTYMVQCGHDVTVFNPTDHPYQGDNYKGVRIQKIYSNEKKLSFFNVFVYDFLSLRHAIVNNYDIILELGYHPASLYYSFNRNKRTKIITNFAGMEWKRSKWNKYTQKLIKYCEKMAIIKSDAIIADNVGIQDYIKEEYGIDSYYSAYGAKLFDKPDESVLSNYYLKKNHYYMMMARFQRDNNFEMILDGYIMSESSMPIIVIGNYGNRYGRYLVNRYSDNKGIIFTGGIYDYDVLSTLRWYGQIYFHGHSCGGTNPSLLEAMASNAFIAAHNNKFNKSVLNGNGMFFSDSNDVCEIIKAYNDKLREAVISVNKDRVKNNYNWNKVCEDYLEIFNNVLSYCQK